MDEFEIISEVERIEIIAVGGDIRDLEWLRKTYGHSCWRKLKGIARVRFLYGGDECDAEVHWYEAHGIGRKELKIKELLD